MVSYPEHSIINKLITSTHKSVYSDLLLNYHIWAYIKCCHLAHTDLPVSDAIWIDSGADTHVCNKKWLNCAILDKALNVVKC